MPRKTPISNLSVLAWAMLLPLSVHAQYAKLNSADPQKVEDTSVIATVNGEEILTDTFDRTYKEYLVRTGTRDSPRLRSAVLTRIINDRLIVADGRRLGMDDGESYRFFLESARRKLLIESFLETGVLPGVEISDRDLEDAFIRINTELNARHLFAHSREEADRLYARLQTGETFEELAREVFSDTRLANNAGSIGTFTFDETDPDFEDAAFTLAVGEISTPVRTAQGYSIIQVLDRLTKPILTEQEFAARKDKLYLLVRRKKRDQTRSHFVRRAADQLDPAFHPAFDRLLGQLLGVSILPDERMDAFLREPLVSFASFGFDGLPASAIDTRPISLSRFQHRNERVHREQRASASKRITWSVADFREHAIYAHADQRAQVRSEKELKDFVLGLVIRAQMMEAAEARGLDERPEFAQALTNASDEWILQQQKERLIDEVRVPEDSIRAHYDRYPTEFLSEKGGPLSFEMVRPRIAEQLRAQYTRRSTLDYVADLRRNAGIEMDRSALANHDAGAGRARSKRTTALGAAGAP